MKKANKMMALTMAAAMLVPQMAFAGESEPVSYTHLSFVISSEALQRKH